MSRSISVRASRDCGVSCGRLSASLIGLAALVAIGATEVVQAQSLIPGQAFVTQFSGTKTETGIDGVTRTVIDVSGASGVAIDLRAPGFQPDGRHWLAERHLFQASAGDVGQVFGVAIDDAAAPNIYLTATALFGLHRNSDDSGWMSGMWGVGGSPGTVYRLNAANGYRPEVFAQITLDGRANSGAALGNIAFDRWNRQFYVSDLETGMIHRIALSDGSVLGRFDHGVSGRGSFFDAVSAARAALPPVAFDPSSSARVFDCPTGDFARTTSCWNLADFRRRVFGLGVRRDATTGVVRLYYAVWSSQGFGNPAWATAGEGQKNSLWSVAIGSDGGFDPASVRREAVLPDLFVAPEDVLRAGYSHPVADIAFPEIGDQSVMLLAERGGVRNLGLAGNNAFAMPHEARVLRYEIDAQGVWQAVGRYDVGFYDRNDRSPPYIRANAGGGVAFGFGYDAGGMLNPAEPDAFVWMTGDALCSPGGPCFNPATGAHDDTSQVHGIEGRAQGLFEPVVPDAAFRPYPAPSPAYPATGPDSAFMTDIDVNVDSAGGVDTAGLGRNDATRIGDIAIYQAEPKRPDLEIVKRALSEQCEAEAECTFEVVIRNVGEATYSGPLMVRDTIGAGGMLIGYAPTVPEGWDCQEVFSGTYECSLTTLTLAPGEMTSLSMTVQVPAWWNQASYSNCVELTEPGSGVDERSYNNLSCGYVAVCTPGAPGCDFDLALTKFGLDGQCDWLGNCLYVTRITNVGAADYTGPLAFHDRITQSGAALADFGPRPDWICGPGDVTDFDCVLPAVTLAPGEFREVSLWLAGPPLAAGHTHVRNCAWIDWRGAQRDVNSGNEYDCSEISRFPPGHPDAGPLLSVDKDGDLRCWPGVDDGTWGCSYGIVVTNIGSAPYFGPFEVVDATEPVPAIFELFLWPFGGISAWTCDPGEGFQFPQTCSRPPVPGGLQPGESVRFSFRLLVPAGDPPLDSLRNCATLRVDQDGVEEQTSCFLSLLCERGSGDCPKDLGITKFGLLDPCFPGSPCPFGIEVRNVSDEDYPGPVVITDTPDPGFGIPVVVPPGLVTCVPAGDDLVCTFPGDIVGGDYIDFDLLYSVPSDLPSPAFKNCASVPPGPNNEVADNDEDCWTNFVPFPDLEISGGTECHRNEVCTLDVDITNSGKLRFVGAVGANGTIAPAVPINSITSSTPGLSCRVTGIGAYECRSDRLDLAPNASAEWQVDVVFELDYPSDEATHTKTIVWPDRDVKDIRPENDEDVSTITILGPKEPVEPEQVVTPQPEPAPAPAVVPDVAPVQPRLLLPDLAVFKAADQATCAIGRLCRFTIRLLNVGSGPYIAPVRFTDRITQANARLSSSGPSPWVCTETGDGVSCRHDTTTINPGESLELNLAFTPTASTSGRLTNCGHVEWVITGRVAMLQHALNQLGFPAGPIDGKMGPRTRNAIIDFEGATGLSQTGQYSDALMQSIFGVWAIGDALANNDQSCISVAVQPPAAPPTPAAPPPSQPSVTPPAAQPSITCTGGTIQNNQCVCPQGTFRRQTGANAYQCVAQFIPGVVPQLTCQGGSLQQGQCICPQGTERKRILPGVFRCERVAEPTIFCGGGTIENNRCVCPPGMEAQERAPDTFKCVKSAPTQTPSAPSPQPSVTPSPPPAAAPSITCTGGSVQNGNCVCPVGTRRQSAGNNAYRCVPLIQAPLRKLIPRLLQ